MKNDWIETIKVADHESTEGVAFTAIIALACFNFAAALAVALIAARQIHWMESRYIEFLAVVDAAGKLP